jgi:hypothetical protein
MAIPSNHPGTPPDGRNRMPAPATDFATLHAAAARRRGQPGALTPAELRAVAATLRRRHGPQGCRQIIDALLDDLAGDLAGDLAPNGHRPAPPAPHPFPIR